MQMVNNITKKSINDMSDEELTRWLCLLQAIDKVSDHADAKKIDLSATDWIKPLNFKAYIKETYYAMLDEVCFDRKTEPSFDKPAYFVVEVVNEEEKQEEAAVEEDEGLDDVDIDINAVLKE